MSLWVIYKFPSDYPGQYVARRWTGLVPSQDVFTSTNLEEVRQKMLEMGLHRMPRFSEDDTCIVETWI